MKLEYNSPELEIKQIKLTNVILTNSLDETIKPTGNIEDPINPPDDPW